MPTHFHSASFPLNFSNITYVYLKNTVAVTAHNSKQQKANAVTKTKIKNSSKNSTKLSQIHPKKQYTTKQIQQLQAMPALY